MPMMELSTVVWQAARKTSRLELMRQRQLNSMFKQGESTEPNELHTHMVKQITAAAATKYTHLIRTTRFLIGAIG